MMKTLVLLLILQFLSSEVFSENQTNPRWKVFGTHIPARADLDVRWEATNQFPARVWVYRLLPNSFSPEAASSLARMCSLTEKDRKAQSKAGIIFQSPEGSKKLIVSFSSGSIEYQTPEHEYGPTNLAQGVPNKSKVSELGTNILHALGLDFSEVDGYFGGSKFEVTEPRETMYSIGRTIVTNVPYRAIFFRRSIDGMPIAGGDHGSIYFGEHGAICRISISWRQLNPIKSCPTIAQGAAVRLLREGNAFQGLVRADFGDIDWRTVKRVTVKSARPCYCSGNSDVLYPFLSLSTVVQTDRGETNLEIDTPLIDESISLN